MNTIIYVRLHTTFTKPRAASMHISSFPFVWTHLHTYNRRGKLLMMLHLFKCGIYFSITVVKLNIQAFVAVRPGIFTLSEVFRPVAKWRLTFDTFCISTILSMGWLDYIGLFIGYWSLCQESVRCLRNTI